MSPGEPNGSDGSSAVFLSTALPSFSGLSQWLLECNSTLS